MSSRQSILETLSIGQLAELRDNLIETLNDGVSARRKSYRAMVEPLKWFDANAKDTPPICSRYSLSTRHAALSIKGGRI